MEYIIAYLLCFFFGLLPLPISGFIWRSIALFLYRCVPSLSVTARQNIRATIGRDWSAEEIEAVIRETFIHSGLFLAEFINTPNLGPDFNDQVSIEGAQYLHQELQEKSGAILVTGHFGNWEVLGQSLKLLGFPMHVFYKKMSNPLVDKLFFKFRTRYSAGLIEITDYKEKTPAVIRANGVIGMIADQDARKHGIFVDFLGLPASTYIGPALLSLDYDAPLFVCFFWRKKLGHYKLVFEPIKRDDSIQERHEIVRNLTEQWVRKLDQMVRQYPGQYFWFHRRWKTRSQNDTANAE
ncbi:lysophospholipid acyltransferase family protein [candidate division CSSED10-310 bacterium]|uniref:Lysophospholipid acyltransferase family protein n=1 Tax=candidate division CSSED10-310 bacterium TaxID=2855610 RepID=A0ABV6YYU6_UNCC1